MRGAREGKKRVKKMVCRMALTTSRTERGSVKTSRMNSGGSWVSMVCRFVWGAVTAREGREREERRGEVHRDTGVGRSEGREGERASAERGEG